MRVYTFFTETAFELAMTFIGFNNESLSSRQHELMMCAKQLFDGAVGVPINLGRYSKYGRGLLASKKVRGAYSLDYHVLYKNV